MLLDNYITEDVTFPGAVIKCSNKSKLGRISFGSEIELCHMAQKLEPCDTACHTASIVKQQHDL